MQLPMRIHVSPSCSFAALPLTAILALAAPGFPQGPPATPVAVCPVVERESPATIRLVGTVLPDKRSIVASEVEGPIISFDAQEGRFLRAGETICHIDPTVAKMWLDETVSRLDSLRQRLTELETGTRPEELRRLRAAVAEAQAWYDRWEFERGRVEDLYAREAGSVTERHNTAMDYEAAKRRLEQSKAALELAENGPRREEIAQAKFNVAAQEAAVRRLTRQHEKTRIAAPFDGFVIMKRTEVGEWIDSGGPIAEMVGIETVRVRVDVPEHAIPFATQGNPAAVEVEALSKRFAADVSRVIPLAPAAARTFPVEIDLPNHDHALLPGMFVWAHVPAGPNAKRLFVNKDAVVLQGTSRSVYVVRAGERGQMAVPTPVSTGLEIEGEIEITAAGIQAGDLLVCRANERLFGPTPVIPTPWVASQSADKATNAGEKNQ